MSKLTDVLKSVAPTLAGAVSGVFGGPAVGLAVKTLGEKLLGKPNATQEEVEKALVTASPEQLLELKKLDTSFKQSMLDFGYKMEELEVRDLESARRRDVEYTKSGLKNTRADVLAYAAIVALAAATSALMFLDVPQANREMLAGIIGALIILVKDVYSFEFGSSKDAAKSMNAMKEWLDEK